MHSFKRSLAAAAAVLAVTGTAVVAVATSAEAAPPLGVTLSAHGTNASAAWNAAGDPVLTVGSSVGTFAQIQVNHPSGSVPASAPTFTTSGYGGGSPHWVLRFSDGDSLIGLPAQAGLGLSNWQVLPASSGSCHGLVPANHNDTYTNQVSFIQNAGCGGVVTSAAIVADAGQAAGATNVITGIHYAGMTLVPGPDAVLVLNPGAQVSTVGTAIAPLHVFASSVKGDAMRTYRAFGLPAGLHINPFTGVISGTPAADGTFTVTVRVTDNGGTSGYMHFPWQVKPATTVLYSGTIRLVKMGMCLDVRANSSTPGAVVQVWGCNGLPNQQWQVMSDGTIRHNGLVLDARDYGTANGTPLQLWSYTGASNQKWNTANWCIHYNPGVSTKVVDDPAFGGPGTRMILYTENDGANQIWATW